MIKNHTLGPYYAEVRGLEKKNLFLGIISMYSLFQMEYKKHLMRNDTHTHTVLFSATAVNT